MLSGGVGGALAGASLQAAGPTHPILHTRPCTPTLYTPFCTPRPAHPPLHTPSCTPCPAHPSLHTHPAHPAPHTHPCTPTLHIQPFFQEAVPQQEAQQPPSSLIDRFLKATSAPQLATLPESLPTPEGRGWSQAQVPGYRVRVGWGPGDLPFSL